MRRGAYSVMNRAVAIEIGTAMNRATKAMEKVYGSNEAIPNAPPMSGAH